MPHDDLKARSHERGLERRSHKRRIYRLNWGKILSPHYDFLSESIIANFTSQGACLRIMRDVDIPHSFLLYWDNSEAVFEGVIIWRMGPELGARLATTPDRERSAVARRMREKYYGL